MKIKKKVLALLLATSTMPGGAIAAWDDNGVGGATEFKGVIVPAQVKNPWEVKLGNAMDIEGSIIFNDSKGKFNLKKSVLILGIRTTTDQAFTAHATMAPTIDFGTAVDINAFDKGVATLKIDLMNAVDSTKIGSISVPFSAANKYSVKRTDGSGYISTHYTADDNKLLFKGGLGKTKEAIAPLSSVDKIINDLDAELAGKFDSQGLTNSSNASDVTDLDSGNKYSAFYGAGLMSGATVDLALDANSSSDIKWKASFPVTVSYQ